MLPDSPEKALPGDPRCPAIQFMEHGLAQKIMKRVTAQPQYFGLPESELRKMMGSQKRAPNATDNRMKMRFWDLFDQCTAGTLDKITPAMICSGVCSELYFMETYINRPERVAWMLTPPVKYDILAREALNFGIEQFRDILALPHVDEITKKVNVGLINAKMKIVQMLDLRAHGAPTQKQVNLNIGASSKEVNALAEQMTMEALQKKIEELDRRDRRAQHIESPPIDVTVIQD